MPKLTMFVLENCPYCKKAQKINDQLLAQERYRGIEIQRIDEAKQPELADRYDYYYVPSYYLGQEKLHEGAAEPADIEAVFERALRG